MSTRARANRLPSRWAVGGRPDRHLALIFGLLLNLLDSMLQHSHLHPDGRQYRRPSIRFIVSAPSRQLLGSTPPLVPQRPGGHPHHPIPHTGFGDIRSMGVSERGARSSHLDCDCVRERCGRFKRSNLANVLRNHRVKRALHFPRPGA